MDKYLKSLIDQGEHQQLDFKYCISDSRKIARTLAAFANTEGGTLLLGVRDNGSIAGVKSEEEYYMIDSAASLYCKPQVGINLRQHVTDGKAVLEIIVKKGDSRPYYAKSENGKWLVYLRKDDQNLLANRVILNVWKREKTSKGLRIKFRQAESLLFDHLKQQKYISLSYFRKIASIPVDRAEKILSDFIICGIIDYEISEKGCRYYASDKLSKLETIDNVNFNSFQD